MHLFPLVQFLRTTIAGAKPFSGLSAAAARRYGVIGTFFLCFVRARVCVFPMAKGFPIRLLHEMQLNYLHASIILFIVCRRRRTLAPTHSAGQPSENSFAAADGTLRVSGTPPPPLLEWNAMRCCEAKAPLGAARLLNRTAINGFCCWFGQCCVFLFKTRWGYHRVPERRVFIKGFIVPLIPANTANCHVSYLFYGIDCIGCRSKYRIWIWQDIFT
jgi:hypothetical protein